MAVLMMVTMMILKVVDKKKHAMRRPGAPE